MADGVQNTYYLSDFVKYKSDDNINYYNFSILEKSDDGKLFFGLKNVIDDYLPELIELSENYILSDDDIQKYMYKPWLLSYDLYGDTELYFIIMLLNDMYDPNNFDDIHVLKLVGSAQLKDALNRISNSEIDFINQSREELVQ